MASQFDVHIVTGGNVGALSNATRALFRVPSGGGDITVLAADIVSGAAGTTALYLVEMGTAGTAAGGTIASFAGTLVAGPNQGTLVTAIVPEGYYVGIKEANVGAANAITIPSLSYIMGV